MRNTATGEDASFSVKRPEVARVLESASGEEAAVGRVIGDDYERLIQLRMAVKTGIKEGEPLYLCAECFTPVYLCCRKEERRFFFRHTKEDGTCSARTRGLLSQEEIRARSYNGAKESVLHQQMKQWLVDSLAASGQFTEIASEKRWTGRVTGAWRKPDVSAKWGDLKVAFEVQLSTTFLDVIAERRLFYLKEGALLIWVFARFDADARRLTQNDVFYNNNQNAFIISPSTREASMAEGKFLLECIWAEPRNEGQTPVLQRKRISCSELTLEPETQRAYFYDFDGERKKLPPAEDTRRTALAADFEGWWLRVAREYPSQYEQEEVVAGFPELHPPSWEALGPVAKYLPADYWLGPFLPVPLLNILYSAKHGKPIGLKRNLFIEVAHYAAENHPTYLPWFRKAFAVYNRGELLQEQDKTGKWRRRVAAYKKEMKALPELYAPDRTHQRLVELLFPELAPLP
jgi:hypothetical protein